jgi:hypothetical protein
MATNTNTNLLENMLFEATISRAPNVSFFGKNITLPSLSIGQSNVPTPFSNLPVPGDHIVFSPLELTFGIDANFQAYLEIYNWMLEIGFPESFDQYNKTGIPRQQLTAGKTSEITITLFSKQNNPQFNFIFEDCWPSDLSSINIDIQNDSVLYTDVDVTLQYTKFRIEPVT